jgi:hypothetical protein
MSTTKEEQDLALVLAEEQHKGVQELANDALRIAVFTVELSRLTAASIAKLDKKTFAKASPALKEWSEAYAKIAALGLPENLSEARPATLRRAIALLEIP